MFSNNPYPPNSPRRWMAIALALSAVIAGGWMFQYGEAPTSLSSWVGPIWNTPTEAAEQAQGGQRLQAALHRIEKYYIEEMDRDSLYDQALQGVLDHLGDPHSSLLTPEEYRRLSTRTRGDFGGLGFQVDVHKDHPVVLTPLPGTPAQRAGLQAGDQIIRVDSLHTEGWSTDKAVQEMRGKIGTSVHLTVKRPGGDEMLEFDITRQKIEVESVEASYMLEDKVGYLELVSFQKGSPKEVQQAIQSFQKQADGQLDGVVIDLRRNPGGLLDVAIDVADLFLPKGTVIAQTRGRGTSQDKTFEAQRKPLWPNLEVTLLTGPGSASGSEVLAGALQDHDRALVVGLPTFGKGSVQSLFPLPDQYYLKLTTALWYTPVGRSLQRPRDTSQLIQEASVEENPFGGALPEHLTKSREDTFYTDAGRPVLGGGGIHPDLVVRDSVRMAADSFLERLQEHSQAYGEIEYQFALDYLQQNPQIPRDFTVDADMLNQLQDKLLAADIMIHPDLFKEARGWLSRSVEYEIARAKWGAEFGRQVLNRHDSGLHAAAKLIQQADGQSQLIEKALATKNNQNGQKDGS